MDEGEKSLRSFEPIRDAMDSVEASCTGSSDTPKGEEDERSASEA